MRRTNSGNMLFSPNQDDGNPVQICLPQLC
jgi:hypothetical protein